jgi:hypothetical protein
MEGSMDAKPNWIHCLPRNAPGWVGGVNRQLGVRVVPGHDGRFHFPDNAKLSNNPNTFDAPVESDYLIQAQ